MVPLYRYWQHEIEDHLYTISAAEIGEDLNQGETGNYDYMYEGIQCYVYPSTESSMSSKLDSEIDETEKKMPIEELKPIYEYWSESLLDHFYTATFTE